ncbi:GlsB/YeaQ/YmgE family stress response membrane protein [Ruania zhangjianzhongii]|uniref:GlsB/YeaQ/YmgE family stress response membrane protein n=1 Tax=Ruania zhangjianzhongii TaxID=2603206 RepID=UPI0011CA607C|nr:GlsB/YeaQ/YmgE family stress response membrane protein [Ruania zhangjianzhongii]
MGFLGFLIVGLICGTLAKAILKDRAVGGWLASLIIGVIGAFVGGWLGGLLLDAELGSFFDIKTWLLALAGSIVVLFIYTAITGKRATRR